MVCVKWFLPVIIFLGMFLFAASAVLAYPRSYVGWHYWLADTETRSGTQNMLIQGFELTGTVLADMDAHFRVYSGNSRVVQIDLISLDLSRAVLATPLWSFGGSLSTLSSFRKERASGDTYAFVQYGPGVFVQQRFGEGVQLGGEVRYGGVSASSGGGTFSGGLDYDLSLGFSVEAYQRLVLVLGYRQLAEEATPPMGPVFREQVRGFYVETSMAL